MAINKEPLEKLCDECPHDDEDNCPYREDRLDCPKVKIAIRDAGYIDIYTHHTKPKL